MPLWAACGTDGQDYPRTPGVQAVVLERVSPTTVPLGAAVTIHGSGFSAEDNDIAFGNPAINFQGRHRGYLNGISSPDGMTLSFSLPDNDNVLLAACAFSQLGPNEACEDIGLHLPLGESEVAVINENGESNTVTLTVVGRQTP